LTHGSHAIVDVSCDYCGDILHVIYKNYIKHISVCDKSACSKKECSNQKIKDVCMIKYGVENPYQAEFVKEKTKKTLIEKYGADHPMHVESIKNKVKQTNLERYGVEYPTVLEDVKEKSINTCLKKYGVTHESKLPSQQEIRKNTRIKNGNQIPDCKLSSYTIYRKRVDNISDILKKELLKNWDGYDYYDNEYIKDNFNLDSHDVNYPTLDHKTSVQYGFLNGISVEDISDIQNLCITKNSNNAKKWKLNEGEFKLKIGKQNDPNTNF